MIINILTVRSKHYSEMSLTALVVSKLIFAGDFVFHEKYVCVIEYVSIKGALRSFSPIVAPLCHHRIIESFGLKKPLR